MRFTRRRVVFGAIGAVVVIALVAVAVAATGDNPRRARAASSPGSTSTSKRTTTSAVSTTTTAAAPSTTIGSLLVGTPTPTESVPDPTNAPPTGTEPPSTTVPSPWPPGTILDPNDLTGSTTFDPPEARFEAPIAYTATLTNPHDQWIFYDFAVPGLTIVYVGLEVGWNANGLFVIARPTDPVFRHETAQGVKTGLLLAPHASQTFTGHIQGWNELGYTSAGPNGTQVFPVSIVFKNECCIGYGGFAAGSLARPPPTTTTGG
jgi:hypothetical protein